MTPSELWGTAVPNWIMALASLGAVGGLLLAYLDRRTRLRRDVEEREARTNSVGDRVWAEWVKRPDPAAGSGEQWGVRVTNTFGGEITRLEVDTVGNGHPKSRSIRRASLGEGRWVFLSNPRDAAEAWSQAQNADEGGDWTPIARGKKSITAVRFCRSGIAYVKDADGRTRIDPDAEPSPTR